MPGETLVERVKRYLGSFILRHSLSIRAEGDQLSEFGAVVRLESDEFVVDIVRDRGQEWIVVGTKVRREPHAHLQSWPLGHIVAYLDGAADPYGVCDLEREANWLADREEDILDSALINSEELNHWAVQASRRLFGQNCRT